VEFSLNYITGTATGTETDTSVVTSTTATTTIEILSTVPTPAGFTPVSQEQGYVPKNRRDGSEDLDPRAAAPQGVIKKTYKRGSAVHSPAVYPTYVSCVKVIESILTRTVTLLYCAATRTTTLPVRVSSRTTTVTKTVTITSTRPHATSIATSSETTTISVTKTTSTTSDVISTCTSLSSLTPFRLLH